MATGNGKVGATDDLDQNCAVGRQGSKSGKIGFKKEGEERKWKQLCEGSRGTGWEPEGSEGQEDSFCISWDGQEERSSDDAAGEVMG